VPLRGERRIRRRESHRVGGAQPEGQRGRVLRVVPGGSAAVQRLGVLRPS
jgi:hypothetical protein